MVGYMITNTAKVLSIELGAELRATSEKGREI